jgi:hypothetical protein
MVTARDNKYIWGRENNCAKDVADIEAFRTNDMSDMKAAC